MMRRPLGILALMLLAVGCRTSGSGGYRCPPPTGTASVTVRAADVMTSNADEGELVVRVRHGTTALPVIAGANVSLHRDTLLASLSRPAQAAVTDDQGIATLLSIPSGPYGVWVRHVGYWPVRHELVVRGGYTDTLDITLRTAGLCLSYGEPAT
jgi:hypothetical protein